MENNQKPEWFELADNDQPVSRPVKNVPKRNLAFILAGVLVLPMGAGFALLSHEDHSAVAAETLNLTQDSPIAARTSSTQPQNAITMPATSREDDMMMMITARQFLQIPQVAPLQLQLLRLPSRVSPLLQ